MPAIRLVRPHWSQPECQDSELQHLQTHEGSGVGVARSFGSIRLVLAVTEAGDGGVAEWLEFAKMPLPGVDISIPSDIISSRCGKRDVKDGHAGGQMRELLICAGVAMMGIAGGTSVAGSQAGPAAIDLAERLKTGTLRAVNREVTALQGTPRGVHVTQKEGPGVVWLEGSDFAQGTITLDVRGRDVLQQSFLGVAFHRKNDNTYEAVYLRPFNFRADDPDRHQHAVQYIAVPDYDWPRLRKEFPEEFENPVDRSVSPTEWVPLRLVVADQKIQVYVGTVTTPTLEVRKLGSESRGLIGLWVGNNSDGDFANLRITPAK
jgi:hypothetical protein